MGISTQEWAQNWLAEGEDFRPVVLGGVTPSTMWGVDTVDGKFSFVPSPLPALPASPSSVSLPEELGFLTTGAALYRAQFGESPMSVNFGWAACLLERGFRENNQFTIQNGRQALFQLAVSGYPPALFVVGHCSLIEGNAFQLPCNADYGWKCIDMAVKAGFRPSYAQNLLGYYDSLVAQQQQQQACVSVPSLSPPNTQLTGALVVPHAVAARSHSAPAGAFVPPHLTAGAAGPDCDRLFECFGWGL